MKRRDFIRNSFLVVPVAFVGAQLLTACGSNSGTDTPASPGSGVGVCPNGGGVTYTNVTHAHTTVALTQAQVISGTAGVYTLLAGSHTHTFNISAGDFTALQAGTTVTGKTDIEGHGHLINIVCA
jgi:hypothetical protein